MNVSFETLSAEGRALGCLGLPALFVSSLYVVDTGLARDHPRTVRRRMIAIAVVCLIAPVYLWLCSDSRDSGASRHLLDVLGVKLSGLPSALVLPSLLVIALYIGPIVQTWTEGTALFGHIVSSRMDLNLRSYVVAPFAEEFVFRACMLPLLLPWMGVAWSIVVCPLFFGLAHLHHLVEWYRHGNTTPFSTALLTVIVQFCYTSIFGMFSAYLFVRTGHLASPVICHAFCNAMGLPSFDTVPSNSHKVCVSLSYVLGLVLFLVLLKPLTDPHLYQHH